MPKRADTKKFLPSVYELPGVHIDFGEEPVSGLKREIYEEFGMEGSGIDDDIVAQPNGFERFIARIIDVAALRTFLRFRLYLEYCNRKNSH